MKYAEFLSEVADAERLRRVARRSAASTSSTLSTPSTLSTTDGAGKRDLRRCGGCKRTMLEAMKKGINPLPVGDDLFPISDPAVVLVNDAPGQG